MATSAPTASPEPVICLGCGEVIRRASERRNLKSSASQHVVPLWKTVMTSQLESVLELKEFRGEKPLAELHANAPVFLSILRECTRTRRLRPNHDAELGMYAAIQLKHRFSKMSLVQKILSLVLYGGHSGKQV